MSSQDKTAPLQATKRVDAHREAEMDPKTARAAKRIKIMRVVQSTLSAMLSLAIAVFQARVYATYQNTKSQEGMWPAVPNVMPTLLLFSVAIAALVFDGCMLVGYMWPTTRFARWAVTIAGAAVYIVSSTKTVSFAISAVVSRTSFDFGNNSGTNSDLWSFTCTDQAATNNAVIQAESNCNTQMAAWGFAIAQLVIEVFGWIISIMVFRQTSQQMSAQGMEERLTAYSWNVNGRLNDATPQFELPKTEVVLP